MIASGRRRPSHWNGERLGFDESVLPVQKRDLGGRTREERWTGGEPLVFGCCKCAKIVSFLPSTCAPCYKAIKVEKSYASVVLHRSKYKFVVSHLAVVIVFNVGHCLNDNLYFISKLSIVLQILDGVEDEVERLQRGDIFLQNWQQQHWVRTSLERFVYHPIAYPYLVLHKIPLKIHQRAVSQYLVIKNNEKLPNCNIFCQAGSKLCQINSPNLQIYWNFRPNGEILPN